MGLTWEEVEAAALNRYESRSGSIKIFLMMTFTIVVVVVMMMMMMMMMMYRVDHWNHEMERVVLLTDNVIIIIKYDFIKRSAIEGKKIPLLCINKLQIADIVFPSNSLMP